jgi:two-component system sensor histidine kinase EvgS
LRLRQILSNFVSNAIKFTQRGTVEVKAELLGRAEGKEHLRFSVKDSGIGIPADRQKSLFQPFSQADADTTLRFGGTGLGLAICSRLARMMDGSIEMSSAPGVGTTMALTLTLPIADPKDLPKADPGGARVPDRVPRIAPDAARAEAEGTLVLLVDDHPTNRALLARQANTLGYAVQSAENGLVALEKWKSGRFGLVLTDCNMPEMNGYELTRRIRELESSDGERRVPIIACTANALSGEAESCFAAGMDDYLAKPVELAQLQKKLDQWLPLPGTAEAVVDPSVGRDILLDFRRANEEDAARLREAVSKSDRSQVALGSHRIKGASLVIGAAGLGAVCERIEHAIRANDWSAVQASMGAFELERTRLNAYLDSI